MHFMARARKTLLAQEPVDVPRLVEILARRQVGLARQTPKMSLQSISRGNTLLAASGFNDVSSMGKLTYPRKLGGA
jgi:hypothetical protein